MEPVKKSNGALVGSIIIILILVLGGIYLWQKSTKIQSIIKEDTTSAETADQNQTEQQAYDELSSVETDLSSETDVSSGIEDVK